MNGRTWIGSGEGGITLVDEHMIGPAPLSVPGPDNGRAVYCKQSRLKACGVTLAGPAGGRALVCRDAQGEITGPVRSVAPDGSIVIEGACERHLATGAWLWWRDGRLEKALGYGAGTPQGIIVNHREVATGAGPRIPVSRGREPIDA